jgi:hypothetical protein
MFTGNEGEEFSLATASEWTANYRAANTDDITAHFFGREILLDILGQEDCVGLRIYYALDEESVKQMIIVGVDANGHDQYSSIVAERSMPCPPYCDSGSSPLAK